MWLQEARCPLYGYADSRYRTMHLVTVNNCTQHFRASLFLSPPHRTFLPPTTLNADALTELRLVGHSSVPRLVPPLRWLVGPVALICCLLSVITLPLVCMFRWRLLFGRPARGNNRDFEAPGGEEEGSEGDVPHERCHLVYGLRRNDGDRRCPMGNVVGSDTAESMPPGRNVACVFGGELQLPVSAIR